MDLFWFLKHGDHAVFKAHKGHQIHKEAEVQVQGDGRGLAGAVHGFILIQLLFDHAFPVDPTDVRRLDHVAPAGNVVEDEVSGLGQASAHGLVIAHPGNAPDILDIGEAVARQISRGEQDVGNRFRRSGHGAEAGRGDVLRDIPVKAAQVVFFRCQMCGHCIFLLLSTDGFFGLRHRRQALSDLRSSRGSPRSFVDFKQTQFTLFRFVWKNNPNRS